jgi:predicted DCC family thiol-disulfide oxidoreductase YuxK
MKFLPKTLNQGVVSVTYDGECPLCKSLSTFSALNSRLRLKLRDARLLSVDELNQLKMKGFDLSYGMLVQDGSNLFYGEEALIFIFLHSGCRPLFVMGRMMSSWNRRARVLCYKALVKCRNLLLVLLGGNSTIRGVTDLR